MNFAGQRADMSTLGETLPCMTSWYP